MDIPGYQYDPVKKRYFKILKTGELPNSPYTISALASTARNHERVRKTEFARDSRLPFEWPATNTLNGLGSRSHVFLPGRSAEQVTCFALVDNGVSAYDKNARTFRSRYAPVVGHRDGVLSTFTSKTSSGKSIVALESLENREIVAAAVDNALGSVIASEDCVLAELPKAFVSRLAIAGNQVFASSNAGLTLAKPDTDSQTVPMGSLSTVASRRDCVAIGKKNGKVQLFDVAKSTETDVFTFPNSRTVTNLALTDTHLILATGLEDHMYLLDPRAKPVESMVKQYEYANWSHRSHGISWSPHSAREFAVAQEDGIAIYDLGAGLLTKIPTKHTISPCVRWTTEGIFYAAKNAVRLISKRRTSPSDAMAGIDGIHDRLNQIAG